MQIKLLLNLLWGSVGAISSSKPECSATIDGHRFNLESLRLQRFEVPTNNNEKLIFSICDEVDNSGGVAYILKKDNSRKIIGSLQTGHSWKPIKEVDDDDGIERYTGVQTTYYGQSDLKSKGSQWVFRIRSHCTLNTDTPLLKYYNVDYTDRTATVDLGTTAACPTKIWSPVNFFERYSASIAVTLLVSALVLGFSSGSSLQTYSSFTGLVLGAVSVAFLSSYLFFGSGLLLSGPGAHSQTAVTIRLISALILSVGGAIGGAVLFASNPNLGLSVGGAIALGGTVALLLGPLHFLWRFVLGKMATAVIETIIVFAAIIAGGIIAINKKERIVPLLCCVIGAYVITTVIGRWAGSFPRQSDLWNYIKFAFGIAQFNSKDGHIEPAGGDSGPFNAWYAIRGQQSFIGAIGYLLGAMALFGLFIASHVNAYGGYRQARDVNLSEEGGFYERAPHGEGVVITPIDEIAPVISENWLAKKLKSWFGGHEEGGVAHHHHHRRPYDPNYPLLNTEGLQYFDNPPIPTANQRTPLLSKKGAPHIITPNRNESTRAPSFVEGGGGGDLGNNSSRRFSNVTANPQQQEKPEIDPHRQILEDDHYGVDINRR